MTRLQTMTAELDRSARLQEIYRRNPAVDETTYAEQAEDHIHIADELRHILRSLRLMIPESFVGQEVPAVEVLLLEAQQRLDRAEVSHA